MGVQFYNYSGAVSSTSVTTTDDVTVGDDLVIGDDVTLAAGSVLTWATDTNLYRSAADTLKTDDALVVTGAVTAGSAAVTGALTVAGQAISPLHTPVVPADHGFIAWSTPIATATATSLLSVEAAAGTLRLTRIRRVPATSVTNVSIFVTTAGGTLTTGQCFAALYTAAGALIGVTADQAAQWQGAGLKTAALAGGPFALTAGDYYVGLWYNGTTAPTVLRTGLGASGAQINAGIAGTDYVAAYADTGLTTTAPSTIGAKTASALFWWAALS